MADAHPPPFFFSFRTFAFISELDSVCLPPTTHLESYTGSHIVSDRLDGSPSHRPPIIDYARSSLEWRFPTLVSSTCPQCVSLRAVSPPTNAHRPMQYRSRAHSGSTE
jgi:hypothetical protein